MRPRTWNCTCSQLRIWKTPPTPKFAEHCGNRQEPRLRYQIRSTTRALGLQFAGMHKLLVRSAPLVVVYPADDDFNPGILDRMVALARQGCDVVCASRFIPGGTMRGCPWLKATLVRSAAFTLHHFARLPTHDPTSGFRLFSRRVIENLQIESDQGFTYSLELLVKAHRLGWRIGEVPALWFERKHGASRFRVIKWLPAYLRWYGYAFATTFLRRPPDTVARKPQTHGAS